MGNENQNNEEIELTEDELLAAIKESGLSKSFQAYIQKVGDRRLSEGLKTYEKNQGKKDLSDKERIESLETELKEMKNGKAKDDIKTKIINELKAQGLNEGLLKYVKTEDLDDQSKIAEAVTNLKNDLLETKQAEIDQKLKSGTAPLHGEADTGKEDSVTQNYAKNKNAGKIAGNPFEGKLEKEGVKQ